MAFYCWLISHLSKPQHACIACMPLRFIIIKCHVNYQYFWNIFTSVFCTLQNTLILTLWTMLCHFFWILNDNKSIIWNPHRGTNDCLFSICVETLWRRENSFSFAVRNCFDSTYCTPFLITALFKTLNALRKRIKDIFTCKDKGISVDHAISIS